MAKKKVAKKTRTKKSVRKPTKTTVAKRTAARKKPAKKKAVKRGADRKHDGPTEADFEWMCEMRMKKEPLRPELRRYVDSDHSPIGPFFRHPLLIYPGVDLERCAWINWVIEYKQNRMEELRREGRWLGVLMGYESAFLLEGFIDEMEHFDDATYWEALAYIWIHQEQLWPNKALLLGLFQSPRPQRDRLMDKKEHRAFAKLPDLIPVFRGYVGRRGRGLSWTTDKDTAIGFAKRFAVIEELGQPQLLSGIASKKDILAYFTRRKESEVVIDPKNVKQQKTTVL